MVPLPNKNRTLSISVPCFFLHYYIVFTATVPSGAAITLSSATLLRLWLWRRRGVFYELLHKVFLVLHIVDRIDSYVFVAHLIPHKAIEYHTARRKSRPRRIFYNVKHDYARKQRCNCCPNELCDIMHAS